SRQEDARELGRLQRRQQLRDRLRQIIWQLDSAISTGQLASPETQSVRDFAAQLHRALAGQDDDLLERSALDLETAWAKLSDNNDIEITHPDFGQARPESPSQPPAKVMVNCANCGARLPPGFAFCGKCGVPLKKDACSACGAALVVGFTFCGKCG